MRNFQFSGETALLMMTGIGVLYCAYCAILLVSALLRENSDSAILRLSPHQLYAGLGFLVVVGWQIFTWVFGIDLGPGFDEWM